jgi:hypothetical protein
MMARRSNWFATSAGVNSHWSTPASNPLRVTFGYRTMHAGVDETGEAFEKAAEAILAQRPRTAEH